LPLTLTRSLLMAAGAGSLRVTNAQPLCNPMESAGKHL